MDYAAVASFQTGCTKFAAACASLGIPWKRSCLKHVEAGHRGSQRHDKITLTWHLGATAHESANDLFRSLNNGSMHRETPAHPLLAALVAIENYQALTQEQPGPVSLVPANAEAWQANTSRLCALRPATVNDGNLNAPCQAQVGMEPRYAAVAALCGFPFHASGSTFQFGGESAAFPSLTLRDLVTAFMHFDNEMIYAATHEVPLSDPLKTTAVTHTLPGYPAGEHPAHYALAAVSIYARLAGPAARKPATVFLTSNFCALIPLDSDHQTQSLTAQFLTQGGGVFLQ